MCRYIALIVMTLLCSTTYGQIIDSDISLEQALEGSSAPKEILQQLVIVDVEYYSVDSLLHRGQMVVNREIEDDVVEIFEFIKEIRYPVVSVIPIKFDMPGGNTSMAHLNNSYSFHYRPKAGGGSLSLHSYGMAIDFNPFDNPYISKSGRVIPEGAHYDRAKKEALTRGSELVYRLVSMGWIWGGSWSTTKDYMHFQRSL